MFYQVVILWGEISGLSQFRFKGVNPCAMLSVRGGFKFCVYLRRRPLSVIIQWKLLSRNVVWLIMLYKVVLTFKSGDEILKCDRSAGESYWAVLSSGTVQYVVQGGLTFASADQILKCTIQMNPFEKYFPVILIIILYQVVLIVFSLWMNSSQLAMKYSQVLQCRLFFCEFQFGDSWS